MSYIYYPPAKKDFDIDSSKLAHPYYVQLAPDGTHLIPGMLQQGEKPQTGHWLQAGNIQRSFPKRYFVQYTDFNTLVPGSLVQSNKQPRGKWKELKKNSTGIHRIKYNAVQYFGAYDPSDTIPESFVHMLTFNTRLINENILTSIYPGINPNTDFLRYKLFSFYGSFDDLDDDVSKLVLFSPDADVQLHYFGTPERYDDTYSTEFFDDQEWIEVTLSASDGNYMLALGILNDADEIVDYITFEDYLNKSTSA